MEVDYCKLYSSEKKKEEKELFQIIVIVGPLCGTYLEFAYRRLQAWSLCIGINFESQSGRQLHLLLDLL
jgi:hypothetical protein